MRKTLILFTIVVATCLVISCSAKNKENRDDKENKDTVLVQSGKVVPTDVYSTGEDSLYVTLVGHGSLMFEYEGKIIHIDPYSQVVDYSKLPKADLIIITHEHSDHLDTAAINAIKTDSTSFIVSQVCHDMLGYGTVISNNQDTSWNGIPISAFPAYNIVHKKPDGDFYHPKGRGNAYALKFGKKLVYVGGDTENIPELETIAAKQGQVVDIAFLPKNLPYTMTDEMFIDAAEKLNPKVLYPYHFSEFDTAKISTVLKGKDIELKVRPMSNK